LGAVEYFSSKDCSAPLEKNWPARLRYQHPCT